MRYTFNVQFMSTFSNFVDFTGNIFHQLVFVLHNIRVAALEAMRSSRYYFQFFFAVSLICLVCFHF